MRLIPPPTDINVILAEHRARRAVQLAAYAAPERAFIGVSLGAWLTHAQAAGVPCVPASRLYALPYEVMTRFDEPQAGDEAVWAAYQAALDTVPADHMVRWDACAGGELKWAMSEGLDPLPVARQLFVDDPRAFDILCEYPADAIPVWSRPWVKALQCDGYPVEFRVFVRNDEAVAVSSYYPQRPLPETEAILGFARQALAHAQAISNAVVASDAYPWLNTYPRAGCGKGRVNATLDFLVTEAGAVLFLEAGPPLGAGAHPCCFLDREDITGVALALAPGVEPR